MKADTLTIKELFQKDVHYVIPPFQRPYVWEQERQWEPLWVDVQTAAERYLDELVEAEGAAEAEAMAGRHFMGAAVFQQVQTPAADAEQRLIIDGQQRLTTLQLLLDAAQETIEGRGHVKPAKKLAKLVLNDELYVNGPDQQFKLWPTNLDQPAFRAAMDNDSAEDDFDGSRIVDAHSYFQLAVGDWLDAHPEQEAERVDALEVALGSLLEMVVINLGPDDDPHVIFETLNARGTPLLESDLVKNYLLHVAGDGAEIVHKKEWAPFEEKWWRTDVRQGRITRPRLDVYLNYWLIARSHDNVPAGEVFRNFRRYVEVDGNPVMEVAADVRRVGDIYEGWEDIGQWTPDGRFFYRWRTMDAGVTTPLLLWLFAAAEKGLDPMSLRRCLAALESLLLRRLVCRMTTKGYNNLVLDLIKKLESVETDQIPTAMIGYLLEQEGDARLWPDDAALGEAFLDRRLYQLLTRAKLRMILEALEEHLRGPRSEEEHVPRGKLTIEHVLPQSWEQHWPLAVEGEKDLAEVVARRGRLLHTIGNLTLVTDKLNPAMSNSAWDDKRPELAKHTVLQMNKQLLDGCDGQWDEAAIVARSAVLSDMATDIWPHGEAVQ
ncbi:MAG: DUF262 domain-containing protein [Hyphomicrobiales bacterium]|nr:DUF262 domain-containing protein [Hyphomicrobiales bacterium]